MILNVRKRRRINELTHPVKKRGYSFTCVSAPLKKLLPLQVTHTHAHTHTKVDCSWGQYALLLNGFEIEVMSAQDTIIKYRKL